MNPGASIDYPQSQYKKFIKDVVTGTLERSNLIEEQIRSFLENDINLVKTDKLLKIILFNVEALDSTFNIDDIYNTKIAK